MDRKDSGKSWGWLPAQMPGVAKLIAEKRRALGDAHVNACWRAGVVELQPGFFFAREGALSVGTPAADDPEMANFAAAHITSSQAFLFIRTAPIQAGPIGPAGATADQ